MNGKEMPMAETTEKAALRSDNPVEMLLYDIRHRFGLTGSCLVQTKRFQVLFCFALLSFTLV